MPTIKFKKPFYKFLYCFTPTIWYFGKGKTMETIKRSVLAKSGGGREKNRQHTQDVQGTKHTLCYYDNEHVFIVLTFFPKTIEYSTP